MHKRNATRTLQCPQGHKVLEVDGARETMSGRRRWGKTRQEVHAMIIGKNFTTCTCFANQWLVYPVGNPQWNPFSITFLLPSDGKMLRRPQALKYNQDGRNKITSRQILRIYAVISCVLILWYNVFFTVWQKIPYKDSTIFTVQSTILWFSLNIQVPNYSKIRIPGIRDTNYLAGQHYLLRLNSKLIFSHA